MKNSLWLGIIAILLIVVIAVSFIYQPSKPAVVPEETPPPIVTVKAPAFNADSAYGFVEKQVSFGPRVPNTKAHRQCGDYLIESLKRYGATVTVQAFADTAYNGTILQGRNIIASYFPEAPTRILLAAHWDTRHVADKDSARKMEPIDGANDGGSGVGILLEIARTLRTVNNKPGVGVDIIFFDLEDYGIPDFEDPNKFPQNKQFYCLGSQYWGKNLHKPSYSAYFGILLDMAGAKNSKFYKEETSLQYASSVMDRVWAIGNYLGYGAYFTNERGPGLTDDHTFINEYARIPTIDIIDYDYSGQDFFGNYHHTHADNMDIIDRSTLKAVGQTVLQTVYEEGAPVQ